MYVGERDIKLGVLFFIGVTVIVHGYLDSSRREVGASRIIQSYHGF